MAVAGGGFTAVGSVVAVAVGAPVGSEVAVFVDVAVAVGGRAVLVDVAWVVGAGLVFVAVGFSRGVLFGKAR